MSRFAGRHVLVAGGTGALGSAIALALLAEGARVTATGRRREPFERLQAAAWEGRDRLGFLSSDAADPGEAEAAVAAAAGPGGPLDAVVNTVGGWAGGAPLRDEPPDRLARMLAANLAPAHALLRAALPALARTRGAFVQIASVASVGPQPGQASYAAAKAALLSLVASVADEVRAEGVRVNAVLPGTLDTEANRAAMPGADRSGWVSTAEVAAAVLFLCSGEAAAVSGVGLPVRRG